MPTKTMPASARDSLIALTATTALTAAHHIFRLGPPVILPSLVLLALPYVLLRWYRASGGTPALWTYAGFVAVIVLWFSIIDGFMDHVLKAMGLDNTTFLPGSEAEVVATYYALWSQEAGSLFYEWTGILTAVGGLFVVYFTLRFLHTELRGQQGGPETAGRS